MNFTGPILLMRHQVRMNPSSPPVGTTGTGGLGTTGGGTTGGGTTAGIGTTGGGGGATGTTGGGGGGTTGGTGGGGGTDPGTSPDTGPPDTDDSNLPEGAHGGFEPGVGTGVKTTFTGIIEDATDWTAEWEDNIANLGKSTVIIQGASSGTTAKWIKFGYLSNYNDSAEREEIDAQYVVMMDCDGLFTAGEALEWYYSDDGASSAQDTGLTVDTPLIQGTVDPDSGNSLPALGAVETLGETLTIRTTHYEAESVPFRQSSIQDAWDHDQSMSDQRFLVAYKLATDPSNPNDLLGQNEVFRSFLPAQNAVGYQIEQISGSYYLLLQGTDAPSAIMPGSRVSSILSDVEVRVANPLTTMRAITASDAPTTSWIDPDV